MPLRVLILGGTTEASALAGLVAGDARFDGTLSLAGRTQLPRPTALATRVGGFGGSAGLARFLAEHSVEAVVDATHPYADQMSANAASACARQGVALATVVRTAWQAVPGDRWQIVPTSGSAAAALGSSPRRVFLALGRQDLAVFAAAPQHFYIARVIELPHAADLPPHLQVVQARGPFDVAGELALLREARIDVLVSRNSGGGATYAKIEAARELALPVVMIARPRKATGHVVSGAAEAFDWLQQRLHDSAPLSRRGV
jgi:precorrin-6A/cobalt-precorrin-6A reductase